MDGRQVDDRLDAPIGRQRTTERADGRQSEWMDDRLDDRLNDELDVPTQGLCMEHSKQQRQPYVAKDDGFCSLSLDEEGGLPSVW
jgi:hypothetical protein